MSAVMAFVHHLAAFGLVAALAVEFTLLRAPLTLDSARKLLIADLLLGVCAGVVLAAGILRVVYFEKGPQYYLHSIPFLLKAALFVVVALMSIYPTIEFLSWRKVLRQQQVPVVSDSKRRTLRSILHVELIGIAVILLCAALMARGVGFRS
jgi:putative membrane protein